eukprot:9498814-Pyramimonas_sp.AAC.1
MFNDEATSTTPLQKLRLTPTVEKAWLRRRKAMNWFVSAIGQSVHDTKKFEFIQEMCPDYWPSYNNYELSCAFYNSAVKTKVSSDDGCPTVWDQLCERVQREVDLTKLDPLSHPRIFKIMHSTNVALRNYHADKIVDVVLLSMPRLGTAWAECSLIPGGLPLLKS